jgi:hypothetical protein
LAIKIKSTATGNEGFGSMYTHNTPGLTNPAKHTHTHTHTHKQPGLTQMSLRTVCHRKKSQKAVVGVASTTLLLSKEK